MSNIPHGGADRYYNPTNKVVNDGDTARADDLNAINEAVDVALDTVGNNMDSLETLTNQNNILAERWASHVYSTDPIVGAEGGATPVLTKPTKYSAQSNALEAQDWASAAEGAGIRLASNPDPPLAEESAKTHAANAAADAVSTAADVVSTNADVVTTNADAVSTDADATAAAASAAAAAASEAILAEQKLKLAILAVKNDCINGTFDIWQRKDTFPVVIGAATEQFVADRLGNYRTAGSALSIDRYVWTTGTGPNNSKYAHSAVVVTDSSATEQNYSFHRVLDVNKYSNRYITLKFHAEVVSGAKDIAVQIIQNFGSGGSAEVKVATITVPLTLTNTAQEVEVLVPSVVGKTIGDFSYTEFKFWYSAGSDFNADTNSLGNQSDTFRLGEIEIHETSFSLFESGVEVAVQRPIREETLLACQAYCKLIGDDYNIVGEGIAFSTTELRVSYPLSVPMIKDIVSFVSENSGNSFRVKGGGNSITSGVTTVTTVINASTGGSCEIRITQSSHIPLYYSCAVDLQLRGLTYLESEI
jgi:hypothetical protein